MLATGNGLGGAGLETRGDKNFPHPSLLALDLTQLPVQWVSDFFPGGKAVKAYR
jgi:hypothetical protein